MTAEDSARRGVLVADHNPHMASLIGQMLRSLGRRDIREAHDAAGAMAELEQHAFGILIIDADLLGMDGVQFTRWLRASAESLNRSIPVIMMSSTPDAKRIAAARDAGVTEFLRKPFAANHLQTRLNSIAANPRGFIETNAYTGPDRRRRTVEVGQERRDAKPA